MNIEITKEEENKLLKRKEIEFTTKHPGKLTPTRADARAALLAKLGAKPKTLVLKKLVTNYGGRESVGTAYVYETEEVMEETEPEHIIERNFPTEPEPKPLPKGEAEPKPIKGEEAGPKEEKKEEAKPTKGEEKPVEAAKPAEKQTEPKGEVKPKEKEALKEEKPAELPKPAEGEKKVEAAKPSEGKGE